MWILTLVLAGAAGAAGFIARDLYGYLFRIWWARHKHPRGIREVPPSQMAVRDWIAEDAALRGASDLSHPLFVAKKVCVDEKGDLIAQGCVYLKGELCFGIGECLAISTQLEAAKLLEYALANDARSRGLAELHLVASGVPDQAEALFRKERIRRGWNRSPGQYWTRLTTTEGECK